MEVQQVSEVFRFNLRLLRSSVQLSGEDLSVKMGLSSKRVNDLEGARILPIMEDLTAIVTFFNITFDDLLLNKIKLNIPSQLKEQ